MMQPSASSKPEGIHISERLSQILAQSGGEKKNLISVTSGEQQQAKIQTKTTPLPSPQSRLVTTTAATTTSSTSSTATSSTQRLSLPIIHGQNGQLLMLMNQNDLVRLAQESALSQMLTLAAGRPQTVSSTNAPSANETSSNESTSGGGGGGSILANVVAPISPLGGDGDGGDSSGGLLAEGGHSSGGPGSSDRALRRKSVHNEVEKRRRQKINMWIEKLSAIIPPAPNTTIEQQQAAASSNNLSCKADVLQRTYDYVIQISKAHNDLTQVLSLVQQENELLRSELVRLTGSSGSSQQGLRQVQVITTQRPLIHQEAAPSASPDSNSAESNSPSPTAAGRQEEEIEEEEEEESNQPETVSPSRQDLEQPESSSPSQKISPTSPTVLVASSTGRPGTVALVLPVTTAALTSNKRLSLPASSSSSSSSSVAVPLALTTTARQQQSPKSPSQQQRKRRGGPIENDDTA